MAQIQGLQELIRALNDLVPTGAEIQSAFRPVGEEIIMNVKSRLPKQTGKLADSYKFVRRKYSNGLTIGASYRSAGNAFHLVELGFKHKSGKQVHGKFVERKVFEEIKSVSLERMQKGLGDIIEMKFNK